MLQWSETHVDRPLKMHKYAFIFVVPDIALLTPRMQKSFKIVENHRWGHVKCIRSGPPRGGPIRSVSNPKREVVNPTRSSAPEFKVPASVDPGPNPPQAAASRSHEKDPGAIQLCSIRVLQGLKFAFRVQVCV